MLGPAAALTVPAFEQSRRLQKRLPPADECTEETLPMPAVRSGLQAARLDVAQAEVRVQQTVPSASAEQQAKPDPNPNPNPNPNPSPNPYPSTNPSPNPNPNPSPNPNPTQALLTAQNSLLHQQVAQMQHMMQQQQVTSPPPDPEP